MKKLDLVLLCSVLTASAILGAVFFFALRGTGDVAVITVNGKEYARLPLSQNTSFTVSTEYGVNTVVVQDEHVYIKDADCPDRICVKTGYASEAKTVVCVPHKLTVSIESEVR